MRPSLAYILLAGAMAWAVAASAQEGPAESEPSLLDQFVQGREQALDAPSVPVWVAPEALDEASQDAYEQALAAFYQNLRSGYEHRQRVLAWQFQSGRIIFALVIFLVLVGVGFSWMQFRLALRNRPADEPSPSLKLDSSVEASLGGLKASSSVLGVIILALSLAFFYLYLVHVYEVSEIR